MILKEIACGIPILAGRDGIYRKTVTTPSIRGEWSRTRIHKEQDRKSGSEEESWSACVRLKFKCQSAAAITILDCGQNSVLVQMLS